MTPMQTGSAAKPWLNLNLYKIMDLLFSPMLGGFIWVGGGSAGLVLLIIVIVLLAR
jgi:hypothetical protein